MSKDVVKASVDFLMISAILAVIVAILLVDKLLGFVNIGKGIA